VRRGFLFINIFYLLSLINIGKEHEKLTNFEYLNQSLMHLFYKPDLKVDQGQVGWKFILDGDEARHGIKVMRLQVSDKLRVTDGKGHMITAEVVEMDKRTCTLLVLEVEYKEERPFHLHIALAPTKNSARFEWFLEKATEMGIEEITPVICKRSVRNKLNMARSEKVVISAVKQSLNSYCPQLNEPITFKEFVSKTPLVEKYIAYYESVNQQFLRDAYLKGKDVVILVGPEGDFTDEEVAMAKENGFRSVSLGNTRLRTETAALASCFTINLMNQ
jgi:16S rRNA (uracil1498-N3)-methyltransferase